MLKKDLSLAVLLCIIYLSVLFLRVPNIFSYQFPYQSVERYYHSQDITHEVPGRIFISDSEGNAAVGYLYGYGEDPVKYNFQHPPFIKYLFGFSIRLFGNPFITQILFGILLLVLLYVLGKKIHSAKVGFTAGLLLCIDPLFINISSQILLDLGQSALILLYLYLILYQHKSWLAQGMVLGVLCASKFWAGPLFFVGLVHAYLLYTRKLDIKRLVYQIIIAFLTFNAIYIRSYLAKSGMFNIVFFELKSLKYWFHHSVSSFFGASLILFLTGYMKIWWGNHNWIRATIWSPLWPLALLLSSVYGFKMTVNKKISPVAVFALIPILYLIYLGVQAPFERYYIIILPYLYLTISYLAVKYLPRQLKRF